MRSLVVAPHPDDEVLGPGGTLLRRRAEGGDIGWAIMTEMTVDSGWSQEAISRRRSEIEETRSFFAFSFVDELKFPTSSLDQIPFLRMVERLTKTIKEFEPNEIFVPHHSDAHSDHRITFDIVSSCSKWFRQPNLRRVLSYETVSETGFSLISDNSFRPNWYVNIEKYLQDKLKALNIYQSEIGDAPFPRSEENLVALASFRGSSSGFKFAEAFQLMREFE